jgi:hypothetical protein
VVLWDFPRRNGGIDPSEGSGRKDDVPAMLMAGEFVLTKDASQGIRKWKPKTRYSKSLRYDGTTWRLEHNGSSNLLKIYNRLTTLS